MKSIKSPLLREVIVKILSRVWPEKAKLYEAFKLGLQIAAKRVKAAFGIGAFKIVEYYSGLDSRALIGLGLAMLSVSPFYRGNQVHEGRL
ncbi:MAG: hypothetical protein N3H31_07350 [Candidatus Nezhaarchaeota archaeon]|nr:hypothetical protein [Candidatus Nezhaarchaeota archaeon]